MKKAFIFILIFLFSNCSFDNKSGIWNSSNISDSKIDKYKDFKKLYTDRKSFEEIINPPLNYKYLTSKVKNNQSWSDEFYQESDNFYNFSYNNDNKLIFKSKKISSHKLNEKFLFFNNKILLNDEKGNIILYSIDNEAIIFKFNFYKKKFKKIKKNLNAIVEKNTIYITDNIGYFYAINYLNQKVLWAKNYKVPFRSNLKLVDNKIVAVDQNNVLYVINKLNGDRLKTIPTEETTLKNKFINSLGASKNSLFFLNSYGSLYSINNEKMRIQWIVNLNQSLEINPGNLFYSQPLMVHKDKIIVATKNELYILNAQNGRVIYKNTITSIIQPIVNENSLFLVTKDNLLILLDLNQNKIIYSINISKKIAEFLQTKEKSLFIQSVFIANGKLLIVLDNSYLIKLNINGKIENINKLPAKIKSPPIFISSTMIFLDKNNKINILN